MSLFVSISYIAIVHLSVWITRRAHWKLPVGLTTKISALSCHAIRDLRGSICWEGLNNDKILIENMGKKKMWMVQEWPSYLLSRTYAKKEWWHHLQATFRLIWSISQPHVSRTVMDVTYYVTQRIFNTKCLFNTLSRQKNQIPQAGFNTIYW